MKVNTNYLALSSLLLTSTTAASATVIFTVENYSDSKISTNGALVGALNGTNTINKTTVNSVVFKAIGSNPGKISLTGPGATRETITLFSGTNILTSDAGTGDGSTLTHGGLYSTINNGKIHLAGLKVGQMYEIQMIFSDTRGKGGKKNELGVTTINLWDAATATGAADLNTGDIGGAGKIVTGTFEADGTGAQYIFVSQTTELGDGPYNGYVAAIQLRTSTTKDSPSALLGLGGFTLTLKKK